MFGYIYKTTNLITNKIYIGQKKATRFIEHYKGSGKRLWVSIKKYGFDNFKVELIEECESQEELDEREKYWIAACDARNPDVGYNLAKGGLTSYGRSGSQAYWYGKHLPLDVRQKISLKQTNSKRKPCSEETKQKLRLANIGKKHNISEEKRKNIGRHPSYLKGKHLSDETKKKISETKKANPVSHKGIKWSHRMSEEAKKKISNAMKEIRRRQKEEKIK